MHLCIYSHLLHTPEGIQYNHDFQLADQNSPPPEKPRLFLICPATFLTIVCLELSFLLYLLYVPFNHFAPVLLNYCKPSHEPSMLLLWAGTPALFLSPFHQVNPFLPLGLNLEAFLDAFVLSLSYMVLT